jgi:uncharacterized membrane protein YgdD (TMEM256/DUF423 family)
MQPVESQARGEGTNRIVIIVAGLIGAIGVMAAARASHAESRNLAAVASICLAHGPTLLALGLLARGRLFDLSGAFLSAGSILFVADLGIREWLSQGLFPGAAPLGGLLMIAGWLSIAVAGAGSARPAK